MESLALDAEDEVQFTRLKEIFSKDSLQMCSFTITEKGYNLKTKDGSFMPQIAADLENGPELNPQRDAVSRVPLFKDEKVPHPDRG